MGAGDRAAEPPALSPQLTNQPGKAGARSSRCSTRCGCARPRGRPAAPSPRCWSAAPRGPRPPSPGGAVSPPGPAAPRARAGRVPALSGSQRSPRGSLRAGKCCGDAPFASRTAWLQSGFSHILGIFFSLFPCGCARPRRDGGCSSSPAPPRCLPAGCGSRPLSLRGGRRHPAHPLDAAPPGTGLGAGPSPPPG